MLQSLVRGAVGDLEARRCCRWLHHVLYQQRHDLLQLGRCLCQALLRQWQPPASGPLCWQLPCQPRQATAADTATAGSCGSLSLPLALPGGAGVHRGPPAASTGELTSASTSSGSTGTSRDNTCTHCVQGQAGAIVQAAELRALLDQDTQQTFGRNCRAVTHSGDTCEGDRLSKQTMAREACPPYYQQAAASRYTHLTACLCDEHIVLDAHTNARIRPKLWVVRNVQAWLNSQYHPGLESAVGSNRVGVMYIQAQVMAH
jgi:hypothetical protein